MSNAVQSKPKLTPEMIREIERIVPMGKDIKITCNKGHINLYEMRVKKLNISQS